MQTAVTDELRKGMTKLDLAWTDITWPLYAPTSAGPITCRRVSSPTAPMTRR